MKARFYFRGLMLFLLVSLNLPIRAQLAEGKSGIAATVHPLATEAALQAMRKGGNAIDAAVAAALTLGVVDGFNSGIGGGCFMLIRLADGRTFAIDGRERAPLMASRDMYVRNGAVDPALSQTGPLAVATPGALAAYNLAMTRFGKLSLREHLLYAANIAGQGFTVDRNYADRLKSVAPQLAAFPGTRAIFLKPNGTPWQAGEILKQPDLSNTYRSIASSGIQWFYSGRFAVLLEQWMVQNGGILFAADLASYQAVFRDPVVSTYRDYTIVGFPPPSSGGAHVAEILNILQNFDLAKMGLGSADAIHVTAEAMKLAFADRAYWMGDSDYVKVPRRLISRDYAAALAKKIDIHKTTPVTGHGVPPRALQDTFPRHTTHFSTADAAGNWVACTATINTTFGSKVVVPGTGVVLNNEMDDFSIQPGVPNYFGLIGGEANAIASGKRPLSSMSPTIVLKGNKPVLAVGAAGGPTIISQVALTIVDMVDFGLPLDAALAEGRFHHQWMPDSLRIESKVGEAVMRDLEKRGHKLDVIDLFGATQAVGHNPQGTNFFGASDPRLSNAKAGGF